MWYTADADAPAPHDRDHSMDASATSTISATSSVVTCAWLQRLPDELIAVYLETSSGFASLRNLAQRLMPTFCS